MSAETVELTPLAVRTILAALIVEDALFSKWWHVVGPDFFTDAYYKKIATYIDTYFKKYGKCPDPAVLVDHFQSSAFSTEDQEIFTAVFDDIFTAPLEDWPHYQDHLRLFVRKQAFENSLELSQKLIEKLDFEGVVKAMNEASTVGVDIDSGLVSPLTPEAIEHRWDDRTKPDVQRIPTSIGNLDHYLGGGLKPKTLTIIVGVPSGGKSTALVHLGKVAVLNKFKVLHFTLEMTREDIVDKYDATLTGIPTLELRNRAGEAYRELLKFSGYGDALRIVERPQYSLTPQDLEAFLIRADQVHHYRPDMVIIDYADLMSGGEGFRKSGSDRRFELNYIYTYLHKIGKTRNCRMVSATQANRAAMGKQIITLEDIAEDISKAWIADNVIPICQTVKEKQDRRCRVYIAKQRGGEAQVEVQFGQDLRTSTFATSSGTAMGRVVAAAEIEAAKLKAAKKKSTAAAGSFRIPGVDDEEDEEETSTSLAADEAEAEAEAEAKSA